MAPCPTTVTTPRTGSTNDCEYSKVTTTEFIDGGVGQIAVHDLGGAGENTLLVCHATGFLGRVYQAMARELADDVRVFALDFRGHGDSDHPDTEAGYDWNGMSEDVLTVVDHLAADALHGFGHSMGGAALLGAERLRPETFRSAMVFEPIVPPGQFSGESPLVKAARGRLRTFPSAAEALQRYASKPPLGLFRADVLNDYVVHGFAETTDGVTLKCTPESEAATFANAGAIHVAQMSEIDLDVRVAKSGDGGLPAQLTDGIVKALPHGVLVEFPSITHFGPLQNPVVVAAEIRALVNSAS